MSRTNTWPRWAGTRSQATEPMAELTLQSLFDSLDFSGSEAEMEKWKKQAEPEEQEDPQFARNWRLTLLLYALPEEITGGEALEWTLERSKAARYTLHCAGVWPQVVDWLVRNDLMVAAEMDESMQLQLPLKESKDHE